MLMQKTDPIKHLIIIIYSHYAHARFITKQNFMLQNSTTEVFGRNANIVFVNKAVERSIPCPIVVKKQSVLKRAYSL